MIRIIASVILTFMLSLIGYAQDYQLNFKVVENERTNGGVYKLEVQIRSATATSFKLGSGNFRFNFNSSALQYDSATTLNYDKFSFDPGPPAVFYNYIPMTSTGSGAGFISLNTILAAPGQGQEVEANTGDWTSLARVCFTILDNTEKLDCRFRPMDNIAASNVCFKDDEATLMYGTTADALDTITFNGSWSSGNGTNGAPDVTDACKSIVVESDIATLSGDVECEYFTVASGAQLVVGPSATLRPFVQDGGVGYSIIDGVVGFLIDADATGYGQYIGPGVMGTIKQYVGTNEGWRNVGLPVSGGTNFGIGGVQVGYDATSTTYNSSPDCAGSWGNYVPNASIYEFNHGTQKHEWYGLASAPTGGLEGYSVFTGGIWGTDGIATVQGTFLDPSTAGNYSYDHSTPHASGTGSQSATIQGGGCIPVDPADHKANWDGWALVANPYPCNLEVDAFAVANSLNPADIRIWDRVDSAYIARSGTTIAPMQAFWMKSGSPGSSSITFPNSIRTFGDPPADFMKTQEKRVVLRVQAPGFVSDSIIIRFDGASTKGYDQGEDSYDFLQSGDKAALLSLHNTYLGSNLDTVVAPLYINTIPLQNSKAERIPLRFLCKTDGSFDFSVNQNRLLSQWRVYLEDTKVAPGLYQDITNSKYSFNHKTLVDDAERFILHFAAYKGIGVGDPADRIVMNSPYSHVSDIGLHVVFRDLSSKNLTTSIYDMAGREVAIRTYQQAPEADVFQGLAKGVYLVRIQEQGSSKVHAYRVLY